jgi:hypothetical protein
MALTFTVVTDPVECGKLWEQFSKVETLWDLWDVRKCFITDMNNQLHFVVGREGDEVVGILPLCFAEERGYYSTIGNEFPEFNKILLKDKSRFQEFLDHAPEKLNIYCYSKSECEFFPFIDYSESYFLDVPKIGTIENYLLTFSKKHRYNLRKGLEKVVAEGAQVVLTENDADGRWLGVIEKYNLERFAKESSFVERGYKEGIQNLMRWAEARGGLHMVGITQNGVDVGAEFGVLYNGTYTVMIGGSDPTITNLGKLLIYQHIETAFKNKFQKLDFMAGADAWKKLWNFECEMLYEFKRNV